MGRLLGTSATRATLFKSALQVVLCLAQKLARRYPQHTTTPRTGNRHKNRHSRKCRDFSFGSRSDVARLRFSDVTRRLSSRSGRASRRKRWIVPLMPHLHQPPLRRLITGLALLQSLGHCRMNKLFLETPVQLNLCLCRLQARK